MLLATLEVNHVLSTLEQPEMYKDGNTPLPPSPQYTPPTTGTQVDQPIGFRPIEKTPPVNQTTESTQVSHSQAMNILDSQSSTGQAICHLAFQLVLCPLHRSGQTSLPLLL